MSRYLLDVNVLIALIDANHVHHDRAHQWFAAEGVHAWATCATTENGLLRIVGNPRYPNSLGSPVAVVPILQQLRQLSGHQFWNDDISLMDARYVDSALLLQSGQITDSYLLALAVHHGGKLATLDARLCVNAVLQGQAALCLI